MRPIIYLASASRARKELLELIGLKFKVLAVKVKEGRMAKNRSYAQVVKDNALRKAKEAARKIKAGVVIGADTMMVQGKKIFGKPKNLAEARAMLKSLSSKPQIVYTGLAVMEKRQLKDKVKARLLVDYEKSKVYLDKLSKADINNYFARVSPLDKAGSYDIQGRGAFFVRRIEGCFYNVVGLPLRKLYLMLKELKVNIFIFFLFSVLCLLSSVLSGCSTEYNIATGEEEMFYYNTDKEVQMGRSIAGKVEKEYKPCQDPLVQKRLEDIGKKIAGVCDRKEIDYTFKALEDEEINAVSLPGGFVYVNTGLIEKVAGDDELSAVLAHEVGHIVARHSIKKLQALQGYSVLRVLVAVNPTTREAGTAADIAFTELLLGYSREDELLADQLAVRYAKLAGYNPHAMIDFLERLQEINRRKPLKPKTYFKTHPYVPDRIRVVKQELGEKMNFSDYINIEQQKNE